MNTKIIKLSAIKQNPNNPRSINKDKFEKLVKSIQDFPKMLELRPIVLNKDNIVLGGNMRLKACKQIGLSEVPVVYADDLTEEEQRQFIIKDNVGFGDWDWELLANEWDVADLNDWGLNVWQPEQEVDYSILDEEDINDQLQEMADGVKKAILIEFDPSDYWDAFEIIKFWREQKAYVGKMIIDHLTEQKDNL